MDAKNRNARIAGFLYLIVVVSGIFTLMYVPGQLIVKGDAAATVQKIVANESLYRWGIAAGFICYTAFLLLPLFLYKLLHEVNEWYARLMVVFVIVSSPISFLNLINKFAVLSIINGPGNVLQNDALQSQVMFYNGLYNYGILITFIFWGLWLLPFGYLVFRSGFLPKFLGILLMIGCFGYLINVFGRTLIPDYNNLPISSYISIPGSLGEIGTCLWLLIVGVRKPKSIS
ncbi:MAG: DUF4386 domain-containing protein [Cyclobacteriaceae bacterium]|nr:DUF4386 domain-containing protein [Cyclobacteriaceae bacterium]